MFAGRRGRMKRGPGRVKHGGPRGTRPLQTAAKLLEPRSGLLVEAVADAALARLLMGGRGEVGEEGPRARLLHRLTRCSSHRSVRGDDEYRLAFSVLRRETL